MPPYIVYALLVALFTIVGGLLPLYTRFRDVEMRYLIAFASGVMVSTAFFEMIPEVKTYENTLFLGAGFFILYLTEKSILIHACGEEECEIHTTVGWVSLIGIGAESLVDGMAIAVGYRVAPFLGLTIALAVVVHEIPRGFSTTVIMKSSQYGLLRILGALGIDSLLTPVGAIVSEFFPSSSFNYIVAFAAGTFLYVGAADLLPEAHLRFNVKVMAAVIFGAIWIPIFKLFLG